MLFHDMMFSFRLYPHTGIFEANVAAEVDYQVKPTAACQHANHH